jgi:pectinesterase
MVGWGEVIGPYVDTTRVTIHNRAIGGRSSRTFRHEGRWSQVLENLGPGDILLVQFGHNDGGPIGEENRFRGSLPGIGDDTETVLRADGTEEVVRTFGWYMRNYALEAKAKGATVVLLSPVPHQDWQGDQLKRGFVDHRQWTRQVARQADVHFVDLNQLVSDAYNRIGPARVAAFFADARTHTTREGAEFNAAWFVAGLKGLPGTPLEGRFSAAADSIEAVAAPRETTVATDGTGDFTSVQAAVDSIPDHQPDLHVIRVRPGVYREVLTVSREKSPLLLVGTDAATTILTFDNHARTLDASGREMGTFRSASVFIDSNDFTAENITFENSHGPGSQALAIHVSGDRATFRHCRFLGWQDTILVRRGRQYFEHCYVAGHVDFIFGDGTAYFQNCEIHCLADGYITAASTGAEQEYGLIFNHCRITGAAPETRTYLGRPWRPHAQVTFLHSDLSEVVRPPGWNNWRNPDNEATARYFEYGNTGPGAQTDARVAWAKPLDPDVAQTLTPKQVFDGWDPNHAPSPRHP